MEYLHDNIPLIRDTARKIARFCPDAVVITTTNPVDPLNYAMYRCSGFDRQKLLGYSLNDSIRFRMMIAKALGVKSTQVDGIVMGEHGENLVMLFSSVRVDGKPITVTDDFKQNIRKELPNILKSFEKLRTGRTAGWTSAIGLASMVGSNSREHRAGYPLLRGAGWGIWWTGIKPGSASHAGQRRRQANSGVGASP